MFNYAQGQLYLTFVCLFPQCQTNSAVVSYRGICRCPKSLFAFWFYEYFNARFCVFSLPPLFSINMKSISLDNGAIPKQMLTSRPGERRKCRPRNIEMARSIVCSRGWTSSYTDQFWWSWISLSITGFVGPRVVGWGTVLPAGWTRVRFLMTSLNFSNDLIFPVALWPWGRLSL
jgi:hypothetical protein